MADDSSCGTWMIILLVKKWRRDTARREHALFAQGQGLPEGNGRAPVFSLRGGMDVIAKTGNRH